MPDNIACSFCQGAVHALPHGANRLLHCTSCQTRQVVPAIVVDFPIERGRLLRRITYHRWMVRTGRTTRTASARKRIAEDWELLNTLRRRFDEARRAPLMEDAA